MKFYQNGDRCPCCGALIEGMSERELKLFSQLVHTARLGDAETLDLEVQDMDTGILKPPDAGINPPVKPIGKW